MHRVSKQLLYGTFYLACWGIFGFLTYTLFLKPSPSCFDNRQNQGELGVDCGGPCSIECIPASLEPLVVTGSVLILPVDVSHVSVLAEIVNPNASEAAQSFPYSFTFYSATGVSTTVTTGVSYAYAGEVKYLVLPNVPVTGFLPAGANLTIGNVSWIKSDEFQKPKFSFQNYATTISPTGNLEVDGRIANQDIISFDHVLLVAVFYGHSSANPIGVSETDITGLNINDSKMFTILHPNISNIDLTATKVFAYAYHP